MGKFYITAFAGFPFEPFLNYTLFGSSHSAGWFHNWYIVIHMLCQQFVSFMARATPPVVVPKKPERLIGKK